MKHFLTLLASLLFTPPAGLHAAPAATRPNILILYAVVDSLAGDADDIHFKTGGA